MPRCPQAPLIERVNKLTFHKKRLKLLSSEMDLDESKGLAGTCHSFWLFHMLVLTQNTEKADVYDEYPGTRVQMDCVLVL
jgi:hypothetical protein